MGSSARISFGLPNHRARHSHQLLLPTGKLIGEEGFLADNLEAIESVRHHSFALGFLDVAIGKRQVQILGDGEVIEQVILLENKADIFFVQLHAAAIIQLVHRIIEQVIFALQAPSSMPMIPIKVDLPAPDGPMTVMKSPSRISRLMRRSTHVLPAPDS